MITPGVSDGPAPLVAAEAGMAVTGSRLPASARPRSPAPAACAEALKRNHRTLTLAGNIDMTTDETVRDSAARCLRDLNFCDSTGVRALRWVLRRAALVGASVCIIPPGEHLRRVLALLGANDLLAVIDSAGPVRAS